MGFTSSHAAEAACRAAGLVGPPSVVYANSEYSVRRASWNTGFLMAEDLNLKFIQLDPMVDRIVPQPLADAVIR